MEEKGELTHRNAKKVFLKVFETDADPDACAREMGLKIVEDQALLEKTILEILDRNPEPLSQLLDGKEKVFGFFVGQVIRELKGKARPEAVQEALKQEISKRKEME